MYQRIRDKKENKSKAIAGSLSQKNCNKQIAGFVDNRPEAAMQRRLISNINNAKYNGSLKYLGSSNGSVSRVGNQVGTKQLRTNNVVQRVNVKDGLPADSEHEATNKITEEGSVLIATNTGGGMGHTRLYIETSQENTGKNHMIELDADGSGSSGSEYESSWGGQVATSGRTGRTGSSTGESGSSTLTSSKPTSSTGLYGAAGDNIKIIIKSNWSSIKRNIDSAAAAKSWPVSHGNAKKALDKAEEIRKSASSYSYRLLVKDTDKAKKMMNCSSFGEDVIRAGGGHASADGMAGYKTPGGLAK